LTAHGGKREGSGRKRSDSKKVKVAFSLAQDVVEYLDHASAIKPKAQIIEDALREHKIAAGTNHTNAPVHQSAHLPT